MAEPTVCAVFTHNGRLRCILNEILFKHLDKGKKIGKYNVQNDTKFMNGAVLKLHIINGKLNDIKMVYQGQLFEEVPKEKYLNKGSFNELTNGILGKDIIIGGETMEGGNYIIYLIRHGHGDHNELKKRYKSKFFGSITLPIKKLWQIFLNDTDAVLTPNGINQLRNAGAIIANNEKEFSNIKFLIVSDLRRTSESCNAFMEGFRMAKISNDLDNDKELNYDEPDYHEKKIAKEEGLIQKNPFDKMDMYMLPCFHELDYKTKLGNCDGSQHVEGPENKVDKFYIKELLKSAEANNGYAKYNEEWEKLVYNPGKRSIYMKYYKDQYGDFRGGDTPDIKQCRETNPLNGIVSLIEHIKAKEGGEKAAAGEGGEKAAAGEGGKEAAAREEGEESKIGGYRKSKRKSKRKKRRKSKRKSKRKKRTRKR